MLNRDNKKQERKNIWHYTRQSVFLTGKAGTGKSTFLKYVCEVTKKKHIVLAPTGIASGWHRASRSPFSFSKVKTENPDMMID